MLSCPKLNLGIEAKATEQFSLCYGYANLFAGLKVEKGTPPIGLVTLVGAPSPENGGEQ